MTWRFRGSFLDLFDVVGIGEIRREDSGNKTGALRLAYSREAGGEHLVGGGGPGGPIPSSTPV